MFRFLKGRPEAGTNIGLNLVSVILYVSASAFRLVSRVRPRSDIRCHSALHKKETHEPPTYLLDACRAPQPFHGESSCAEGSGSEPSDRSSASAGRRDQDPDRESNERPDTRVQLTWLHHRVWKM